MSGSVHWTLFGTFPGASVRTGWEDVLPFAALAPGILIYEAEAGKEVYVAVDEGVLVKTGLDVLVSVRRAIGGADLGQLHDAVKRDFLTLDQQEQNVRSVTAKLEAGFLHRLARFQGE